jgi:hypothetical protein
VVRWFVVCGVVVVVGVGGSCGGGGCGVVQAVTVGTGVEVSHNCC